jgi:cell division protein FtsQ
VDRSFAARPPIGRLRLPVAFALPRGATVKRLCIALAALAVLGGGWLWLRDSPLVAVQRVQISGVQGPDAASVDAALSAAARRMTMLDVNVGALRAAVAPFRVVRDLSASTNFPHGLRIHVIEQLPVAALTAGGTRTAVAADGAVLGSGLLSATLPAIAATDLPLRSGDVQDATVRGELSVLGAAPRALLGWVARVFESPHEGLTVAMRTGLLLYFGDATRPHAKWLAAARVLADPSSAGATYIDVRAPERPAAGTTAPGGLAGSAAPAQVSASDPTVAALANTLAEAVSGGSTADTPSATPQPAPVGATQSGAASTGAQEPAPTATPQAQEPAQTASPSATPQAAQTAPQESPSAATGEPSVSTSG